MNPIQQDVTGGQFLATTIGPDDIYTREDLTEEQRMFGQTAFEFMKNEVLPHVERLYAHDWDFTRVLLRKAADLDLMRLEIPEAFGGLGLDKVSAAYVGEQIALNPSFAGSLGAHTSIGTLPLVYFGNEAQKTQYLPRLASGEMIAAYCLTEPQSGSDALAARTSAVLTDDGRHYVLNGQKMWITNGGFADLFTIFAKVNGEKFTGFLVERAMGVISGSDEKKLGLDGSSTTALMLDNVKVPVENVLGTIGEGHKVAFNTLNFGRVKLGTRNISGAKQALAHATKYAKERRQFGKAIAEFGLIRHKLAEMAIRCYVGDAMVYRALGDVDRALSGVSETDSVNVLKTIEAFAVECSVNKVFTSEALAYVVDEAVQVFGGNGYSREFPVERQYRDARITRIYEGTNEINRLIIPTRLLKQGLGSQGSQGSQGSRGSRGSRGSQGSQGSLGSKGSLGSRGSLTAEWTLLSEAKNLAVTMLEQASEVFKDTLKEEQEVLASIANVVIEVYAIESALARTDKLVASAGEKAAAAVDMARVYVTDSADRLFHSTRQVARAFAGRGRSNVLDAQLALLSSYGGVDTIAARRRIADAVVSAGKHPY